MPIYNIRGIEVDFPYDAYDCQITYMDKVIQALQEKTNALLESPTGTGKTLCLLCATLAYRKSLGPFSLGMIPSSSSLKAKASGQLLPQIVYTSRTHSQLRQVIQELKRTNYRPKMIVLGSREQLCIHDKVKLLHGKAQTNACRYVRNRRIRHPCRHFKLTADFVKKNPHIGDEPTDIEDLVNIGRSCGPCPYYVSRELVEVVDILFAPYNYLIDRQYKDKLGIDWTNSILIFDEAHNLESICADAASFDLPSALLTACISEAKNCVDLSIRRRDIEKSNDKSCNPDNFAILRALLLKLEKKIAEVPIESRELGFTRPGPYIYELLAELNVTNDTADMLIGIIEEAVLLLEEDANGTERKGSDGTSSRLETMGDILRLLFKDGGTSHAKYYRVHVQERSATDDFRASVSKTRTLSWWCFNPGIGMADFSRRGVGSVILTSGTLSPMDSFAYELKLEFPVRLENPHVISSNQIWAGVIPEGPSGYVFNSSYQNRDVLEYKRELGNAIVNFARIVPDGLLVFFPSYHVMERCISCWKDNSHGNLANQRTIWERICRFKRPVIEPKQSSLFASSIEDFRSKLNDRSASGAVFFAVCRGKVSEGLDFADQFGRAVIVTGLPFATLTDPKVRLKREYLDEQARSETKCHKPLTGSEWYDQLASRAVNQAVGRVIRHRHDYGAIIFCDERFATSHRQAQVSSWIQPHIKCHFKFGDVVYSLTRFFRDGDHGLLKTEPLGIVNNGEVYPAIGCVMCMLLVLNVVDDDCRIVSSYAETNIGKGTNYSLLEEIIPANRSSLTPRKQILSVPLKQASHLGGKQSKLFLSRTTCSRKASEIVDLTSNAQDCNAEEKLTVYCSSKRQKIFEIEAGTGHEKVSSEMASDTVEARLSASVAADIIKQDKCKVSSARKEKDIVVSSSTEFGSNGAAQAGVPNRANQGMLSASCQDAEVKGTNFLIQVQQKLTESEYTEFVGYMKALKSKAMKIGAVLQSIVKLFSGQERLPLLTRFKHYVPQKYHSLYEQYCTSIINYTGYKVVQQSLKVLLVACTAS
ncbi:hypothetical protein Cgig2_016620 [Carnegiea gigantea]|uniref:Regulator of telomere elongation helicase 1 homolog n=1 Tax=Carnegiea gigantea TaxID=171969 RepID=A0A9Q1QS17_9CARY|nr:hypothetical protein Cgig2_016620 [Carnegiea gigantea]